MLVHVLQMSEFHHSLVETISVNPVVLVTHFNIDSSLMIHCGMEMVVYYKETLASTSTTLPTLLNSCHPQFTDDLKVQVCGFYDQATGGDTLIKLVELYVKE